MSPNRLLRRLSATMLGNPVVVASVVFVVVLTILAAGVSLLPLPDPTAQSVLFRLKPPSPEHLLGTDRGATLSASVVARLSLLWALASSCCGESGHAAACCAHLGPV